VGCFKWQALADGELGIEPLLKFNVQAIGIFDIFVGIKR
jgi:hypothetical protein